MISVDKMLKCRALFLQTIAALYGDSIVFDDDFRHLLQNFYDNYIKEHFSKFALIYCFELKKVG